MYQAISGRVPEGREFSIFRQALSRLWLAVSLFKSIATRESNP
ncbi:MAG: hypothetical protein ACI9P7_002509 [Candidatus Azotimanducaceae bacterium]